MLVVYHGHGGNVAPVVAAAIHAGVLPPDRPPTRAELLALPLVKRAPRDAMGRIGVMGRDSASNLVCYLANRARFAVLLHVLREVGARLGVTLDDVLFVDVMPEVNRAMRLGGLITQGLGLGGLGSLLSTSGTSRAYAGLAGLAQRSREQAQGRSGRPQPPARKVKVFYHCYGSSHTSVIAAAIHIGRLPETRVPSSRELVSVPHFDEVRAALGTAFLAGSGQDGEEVYVVGFGPGRDIIRRALETFLDLRGVPARDYVLADALDRAGWVVKVGGIVSRRIGLVSVGRPLAALGVRLAYRRFLELVRETRAEVRRKMGLGD